MEQTRRWVFAVLALAGALALAGLPARAQAQTTLYVDEAGDDGADCLSPATACRTVGAALTKAPEGATLRLAPGRYAERLTIRRGVSIVGATAAEAIIDGAGAGPVITSFSTAPVTLQGLTVTGGRAIGGGGGIANFGPLSIVDSVVVSNSVSIGEGFQGLGGGIFSFGALTISGTAVISNSGVTGGGINSRGSLRVFNSTIGGNSASAAGGGLVAAPGTVELTHVTVAGNTAGAGGGIEVESGGAVTLGNSIVAANSAGASPDCRGPLASLGGNLLGQAAGCGFGGEGPGDQSGLDPLLGPLADNGGPTPTYALLAGSPAIDAGEEALCLDRDQRGVTRPQGPGCDSGAFELAAGAAGTTWYAAPDGDDGNDCLAPDRPCATLARALALAGPGDTLRAAPGRYDERLRLERAITIEGAGATESVLDAGGGGSALSVAPGVRATVRGLTISGGAAPDGGGVQNYGELALEASIVRDNSAGYTQGGDGMGGGVANFGTLSISASEVISNSALLGGGVGNSGVMTVTDSLVAANAGLFGGGVANLGSARLVSVTLRGNLAVLGGGLANFGRAGLAQTSVLSNTALVGAGIVSYGPLEIDDSVIYANVASEDGGAISTGAGGELLLRSSTVTGNRAPLTGGLSSVNGGRALASGSIIAGNGGAAADCDRLVSQGHNLIGATAGCALEPGQGDLLNVDARLGATAPGQLPVTPLPDSPALDGGARAGCAGADRRGVVRPQGAGCDIGAIERRTDEAGIHALYLPALLR